MIDTHKPTLYFFRNQTHFLKESFVIHDEKLFKKFTNIVEKLCYFTLEMDKIIDGDYSSKHNIKAENYDFYSIVKCHQESIKKMTEIFSPEHDFWNCLDDSNLKYYDTLSKEKHNSYNKPSFSIKEFEEYAFGKHILAHTAIIGMSYIFEPQYDIEKLKEVYSLIFKGIQMTDDIEDFSKDIQENQWTYARSQVEEYIKANHLSNHNNLDKFEERVFYVSGIAEELVKYSKEKFVLAQQIAIENNFKEIDLWLAETISNITKNEELILSLTNN